MNKYSNIVAVFLAIVISLYPLSTVVLAAEPILDVQDALESRDTNISLNIEQERPYMTTSSDIVQSSGVGVVLDDVSTVVMPDPICTPPAYDSEEVLSESGEHVFSQDDEAVLLAQLMLNEAVGDTMDDAIAVGEVVKNRLDSELFPDTVEEVIYQEGQFSNSSAIKNREPSEELVELARAVLDGEVAEFEDPSVLYFRNPEKCAGISPEEDVDWGSKEYAGNRGSHAFYRQ